MLDLVANDVLSEMSAEFAAELKEDTYAPVLGTLEEDEILRRTAGTQR